MSEKAPSIPSAEKSPFLEKHKKTIETLQVETASGVFGTVTGLMGMSLLAALMITNPYALALGGITAAIAGYRFAKNNNMKV